MVKLNIHALYSDLTVVYTLIVLCICQQQNGIRRCITVDRYLYIIQFDIHNGMASLSLSLKKKMSKIACILRFRARTCRY